MNYKRRANKLVKRFAEEMGIIPPLAKASVITYLTYTIENVNQSDKFTDEEKTRIVNDYTKTLNALNDNIVQSN
jgi:hypothetical protein